MIYNSDLRCGLEFNFKSGALLIDFNASSNYIQFIEMNISQSASGTLFTDAIKGYNILSLNAFMSQIPVFYFHLTHE